MPSFFSNIITGCLACLCVISFPGSSAISLASGTSTASSSALVPLPERQQQQVAASPVKDCSTIKNEKERLRCFDTATKRGGSEPLQPSTPQAQSTPNKQAALEAIKILRALASAVSIGISYADYRRRLVDAKVAIDQLPIDLSLGAKESFIGKAPRRILMPPKYGSWHFRTNISLVFMKTVAVFSRNTPLNAGT
jgi:hypothetical protein